MRKLLGIEQTEHGMKSKPTAKDMPGMEQKEHGLKSKPSTNKIMQMEKKEHVKKNGDIVIGRGYEKGKKK